MNIPVKYVLSIFGESLPICNTQVNLNSVYILTLCKILKLQKHKILIGQQITNNIQVPKVKLI